MQASLFLIPVTLGDTELRRVLPDYNRDVILGIRHFIVENVRTARRFLKKVEPSIVIDDLVFYELNKHTSPEQVSGYLKPLAAELRETRLKLKSEDVQKTSPPPEPAQEREDQIRALFGDLFREILSENNIILKNDISSLVTADVVHEVDFLLQAKERQQEEHFRKLDSLIRQQQTHRKESARNAAMKLKKLFMPS